jgi:hypothetical protein
MSVNYSDLTPGTAITWKNTGGDKVLNLKNMTNGLIKEGAKSASLVDGTKGFPEILEITIEMKLGVAVASDGLSLNNYIGWSSSATAGTDNPGGLTGADNTVADSDQLAQLSFVGSLIGATSLGTGVQRQRFWVKTGAEYMTPVTQNSTGQTTTNVDGETFWTVRPWYRRTPIA